MQRGKVTIPKRKKVWRISEAAPLGEFVDPDLPATPPRAAEEDPSVSHQGWTNSSFELLHGVEVSEEDPSTVPAELLDELFKPSKS